MSSTVTRGIAFSHALMTVLWCGSMLRSCILIHSLVSTSYRFGKTDCRGLIKKVARLLSNLIIRVVVLLSNVVIVLARAAFKNWLGLIHAMSWKSLCLTVCSLHIRIIR